MVSCILKITLKIDEKFDKIVNINFKWKFYKSNLSSEDQ